MLFNSYFFLLVFLPITLLLFYGAGKFGNANSGRYVLIGCSLFFYGWWNPIYILLLLGSIVINFIASQQIKKQHDRPYKKIIFALSVAGNLAFLGYFKYMDFFIENVNYIAGTSFPALNIILPLGISFFTLQQIAFLIDVYEDLVEEKSFSNYLWFVSFFPQLIAGPIVSHGKTMPQFTNNKLAHFNEKIFCYGLFVFSVGLFKKVIVADGLAPLADAGFSSPGQINMLDAWLAAFAYSFQVYFDFSGYSDMAVGLGLLFNIRLPINFKSPYKATSIINFWQRWHVSLTNFINAYVYMPLIRLKLNFSFTYTLWVTVIVMAIVGLWHGANWTFIIFGLVHGLALVINHIWRRFDLKMHFIPAWLITQLWWCLSLVPFRSSDIKSALVFYSTLFSGSTSYEKLKTLEQVPWKYELFGINLLISVILTYTVIILACVTLRNPHDHYSTFKANAYYFIITFACLFSSILYLDSVSEFIYFQF